MLHEPVQGDDTDKCPAVPNTDIPSLGSVRSSTDPLMETKFMLKLSRCQMKQFCFSGNINLIS